MFNRDFYPSPPSVLDYLIGGLDLRGKTVLEPSVGAGHLVKAIQAAGAKEVLGCENDRELIKIARTTCTIIEADFLDLKSEQISHIDYIIANPPFSRAAEHINHMFKIAPPGCKIISLCNYETLDNPYSKSREELKSLVEMYGQAQELGDVFATAERATDANVGLVRLDKPENNYSKEFEGFFSDEDPDEPQSNGIMSYNAVRDLVNRYVECIKIFDAQLETAVRLNEMRKDYFEKDWDRNDRQRESGTLAVSVTRGGVPVARNQFKKQMQKAGWRWIFEQMNLEKHSTKGLREDINKFVEQQENIPFTMKNIYKMLEIVIGTTGQRMDKAILEVFEKVTKHHEDNRHNLEGWKTNSHYLLTEKFIMPYVVEADFRNGLRTSYNGWAEPIEDMVKALCYITGMNYDETTPLNTFLRNNNCQFGQWYSWGFFEIKCFKKGTTHFKFQNKDLWAQFNQHVARLLGYPLPEKKEQTKYQERQNGRKATQPAYKPTGQQPLAL